MVAVLWWSLMLPIYEAPAKVNLHLAITDIRDDGYHTLDTSFVYVDVGDRLHITLAEALQVVCSQTDLSGKSNLVYQVLLAFKARYHVQQGLSVYIDKLLPSQAGLGGGSSDAATALWVANHLWGVGCTQAELIEFAAPFGADIPCFLFGQASSATGIGEYLQPYTRDIPSQNIVIAWPGVGVSTVSAFHHFDQNRFHALTEEKSAAKVRARSGAGGFDLGYNDLEQSAVALCSPLAAMLESMRAQSERAWMSGSGSACIAICHSSQEAHDLAVNLQENGLATWVHIGYLSQTHPLRENRIGA